MIENPFNYVRDIVKLFMFAVDTRTKRFCMKFGNFCMDILDGRWLHGNS